MPKSKIHLQRKQTGVSPYAKQNTDKSIAVITPFVNQQALIEQAIKETTSKIWSVERCMLFREMKRMWCFFHGTVRPPMPVPISGLKNNKELINVATSRAKDKLVLLADSKELERLHAGQADDDLYELAQYIKTNGKSEITEKHISSRALGIQPFSTATENAFLENLTHAAQISWLSQGKYVIQSSI